MKKLLILFLLLPSLSWGGWWLVSEQSVGGVVGGFCGDMDEGGGTNDTGTYQDVNNFHSECTATAGVVNYIYADFDGGEVTIANMRPVIWDSSGVVLASADSATGTNIEGTLYRYALTSEVTLTASTIYRVGFAAGDNNFYVVYTDTAGQVYQDSPDEAYTHDTWPTTPQASDQNATVGSSTNLQVWVSNATDDIHE